MKCENCNNVGWYKIENIKYEVMEWAQCYDCLAFEQFKEDSLISLSKILMNASHEKLVMLIARFVFSKFDDKNDLVRLENLIESKDYTSLMYFLEANM